MAWLSRRRLVRHAMGAASAATTLAMRSAGAQPAPGARKTFVLIHGAWHGGWCWRRVADRLEAEGHKVYTPTLTGLGERSHLMTAGINLDTHIADIVNVFEWEDLKSAVLVGHSYGGWPISGAIEHLLPRVSSIVYLDANMPVDGEKGTDGQPAESRQALEAAVARGEYSRPAPSVATFQIADPADAAWVVAKMTAQPIGVTTQAIRLTGARDRVEKKTFIRALRHPSALFDKALAACKADKSWRTYELDVGHDVMVDEPDRLVEILLEVA
jgi:pimeloyl-ACP methyl ester carboxylesterase